MKKPISYLNIPVSNTPHKKVGVALSVMVLAVSFIGVPFVHANSAQQINELQAQINHVQNDSNSKKHSQGILSVEASSLSDAINQLQAQIDAYQARINELHGEVETLKQQIIDTEAELAKQRHILGETIKAMYIEGDISTLEMLATSKDLSDFFDKQQYRESVQEKVKNTLDKVNKLKADLITKRAAVETALAEQKTLRDQLAGQRAEKDRILSMNQAQQNELENQIRSNSSKIAELKKKQAEAEAALARSLSSGSYKMASVGPVSAGEAIGAIGNTGFSSGPHLHLEMRSGNSVVDPSPYIRAQPVNKPPAWISQAFNEPNSWYRSGRHSGIDYAHRVGSPIFAIDSGYLYRGCSNDMLKTRNNDYGYVAIVEHSNGAKSIYAHMSGGPAACNYNTM